MTDIKSNFSIEADDDNAAVISLALKALGYDLPFIEDIIAEDYPMTGFPYKYIGGYTFSGKVAVVRLRKEEEQENHFSNFNDFLKWHNFPKKSEAEIELDKLNEKMQELQAQINRVSETVNKENSK